MEIERVIVVWIWHSELPKIRIPGSVPIEGHKSGSPTYCYRIWAGNIFPMSQGQSSQNLVWGENFVAGKLFTSLGSSVNLAKSDLRSPFQPYDSRVNEFLATAWTVRKVNILRSNLNKNFVFFRRKSIELLPLLFRPASYKKYGFQLRSDRWE